MNLTDMLKDLVVQKSEGQGETLPLSALVPQAQPRRRFEGLEALARSIREQGSPRGSGWPPC